MYHNFMSFLFFLYVPTSCFNDVLRQWWRMDNLISLLSFTIPNSIEASTFSVWSLNPGSENGMTMTKSPHVSFLGSSFCVLRLLLQGNRRWPVWNPLVSCQGCLDLEWRLFSYNESTKSTEVHLCYHYD